MATDGSLMVHGITQQWRHRVGMLLAVLWKATEKRNLAAVSIRSSALAVHS